MEKNWRCHNKKCACDAVAGDHALCGQCRTAIYCSTRCQAEHWPRHATTCRPHSWLSLDANYEVDNSDGGGGRAVESAQSTGKKGMVFATLRDKFVDLAQMDVSELEMNRFVSDFFASVRINLQAVLDTLHTLRQDNTQTLELLLRQWAEARTQQAANGKNVSLAQWKGTVNAKTYGDRTKTDQEIGLVLERGFIYRDLINNCRGLMGIKRSAIALKKGTTLESLLAESSVSYETALDAEMGGKLSLLTWINGLDNSIYLNLDWDDAEGEMLTPWGADALELTQLSPQLNAKLVSTVAESRLAWLTRVRDVLLDLDSMVGLGDIKDSVARFVLQQLAFPSSPITTGRYVNFVIGGNPGTGKTAIAKKFPLLLYLLGQTPARPDKVVQVTTRNDWVAEYEGQTAIKARTLMLRSLGKLLIIDEAYSLINGEKDMFGHEAINMIVNDMSVYRGLSCLMLLGYYHQITHDLLASNEGLNRRFNIRWRIANYTGAELFNILCEVLVDQAYFMPGMVNRGGMLPKEQKRVFRAFTAALSAGKNQFAYRSFKPNPAEMDQYESVYNILTVLEHKQVFEKINAAVTNILIDDYNSTVVSGLVEGGSGTVDVDDFDHRYLDMRRRDVKNFRLDLFIQTLLRYALQKNVRLRQEAKK